MKPDSPIPTHGFTAGLVCGVAVGAVLGLLFAPKRGKELRHQLGDTARRVGHQSAETYQEARRVVGEAVAAGREAFQKIRPDGAARTSI